MRGEGATLADKEYFSLINYRTDMTPDHHQLNPQSLPALAQALTDSFAAVEEVMTRVDDTTFHARPYGRWSIGENVDHLVLSSMGIASVLGRDKADLARFRAPEPRTSRTYPELATTYFVRIAGRTAPPSVSPDPDAPKSREELLSSWRTIATKYAERLPANWTEDELDDYLLQHPGFGPLTLREMLYFTIFHNYHHLLAMQRAEKESRPEG